MKRKLDQADENATTQPVMERLIEIMADVRSRVISMERHLDAQDQKIQDIKGATNMVGSIATNAVELGEQNKLALARIEQKLDGINELAKSGFFIAAKLRKEKLEAEQNPDPEPELDSSPIVEVEEPSYNRLVAVRGAE